MSTPPPSAAQPADAWAEVRARDAVMRYRRSGAGRAVLVLRATDAPDPLWPELAHALAGQYRVIVPELAAGECTADWLGDFLEGLGAAGVAVVASGPCCMPALELALRDAEQVAQVVLVPDGEGSERALDGAMAAGPRGASLPLLVVPREAPAEEALALVGGFLDGSARAAPG